MLPRQIVALRPESLRHTQVNHCFARANGIIGLYVEREVEYSSNIPENLFAAKTNQSGV
ncbi:hypothetical protein NIES2135_09470 [Leptolyngbya boryana NIES-2135]|uniref:Uncharacterized protein n=1 Tax=Leptolyngbya boryana NIES-2135 TaxID=1973484 RepID=A0A1Z4JBQ7_LEPBY|nr:MULTISPECIES: hypothetical protein [Leptolyngbya]MBD2376010.1 hypothetical protein [Leptolyngbya sp. FACHB-238]BAY54133.1 hypothetical protein NIES2135_09470 [Leptolyngbya boryana NIES-2135]MBD2369789.1 hypothetical protein [Leptolyngbya sp. FACHB-161]MBD2400286.1 hypothetical protein [Leptolyngbya sp. FACHB-239]MBN8563354.1 hypothetical protein [Leptolyngbya sp. UWPOB_LEPTO1]